MLSKDSRDAPSNTVLEGIAQPLKADFAKALPGGELDDATFEAVEFALDKADAPIREGARWLTLPERVAALAATHATAEANLARLLEAVLKIRRLSLKPDHEHTRLVDIYDIATEAYTTLKANQGNLQKMQSAPVEGG